MSDVLYVIQQSLLLFGILGFFLFLAFLNAWLHEFYRDIGWIRDAPWPRRRRSRTSSPDRTQDSSLEDHL